MLLKVVKVREGCIEDSHWNLSRVRIGLCESKSRGRSSIVWTTKNCLHSLLPREIIYSILRVRADRKDSVGMVLYMCIPKVIFILGVGKNIRWLYPSFRILFFSLFYFSLDYQIFIAYLINILMIFSSKENEKYKITKKNLLIFFRQSIKWKFHIYFIKIIKSSC